MKILTVVENLERGGTQRVAQAFALEYAKRGHDSAVFAHQRGGIRQGILVDAGIPVFVGGDDAATSTALAACAEFQPEIVHIHRPGSTNPREGELLKQLKKPGVRVVESSHFGRVDYSSDAELIDVHLQLSEWCLWRWRRWLGRRRRSVCGVCVPNPVEVDRFHRSSDADIKAYREDVLKVPDGAFVCGRVGQPIMSKWHPAVLDAFESLAMKRADAYLVVIGLPVELEAKLDSLPASVRERVLCRPLIDNDEELSTLYSSLDVFLHGALIGETFGLVLAEAMLCGTPAITMNTPSKDNSQSLVVGHGVGGYVALSAQYLADSLHMAYDDREQWAEFSRQCRDTIVKRFSSDRVAAQALRVIEHVASAQNPTQLRQLLNDDPELVCHVDSSDIRRICRTGVGKPSMKELSLMWLVTNPVFYRCYRWLRGR